jgi:hydroxymethylpyrimidine pyrophosphatase-like HAD family hydrolase
MEKKTIAVDLDGTLAKWTPDKFDPAVIGAPIKPMVERVKH